MSFSRDDIDLESLQNRGSLRLILVDHHNLDRDVQLAPSVVAVIDHRPVDPTWTWYNVDRTLTIAGSCCTLIAEKLLLQAPNVLTPEIAMWLLGNNLFVLEENNY